MDVMIPRAMHHVLRMGAVLSLFAMAACSNDMPSPGPVGADRDANGCLPSGGYQFCPRTGECERPWELAAQVGFADDIEAFSEYCSTPADGAAPAPQAGTGEATGEVAGGR